MEGRDELGGWDWHMHTTICKIDNQQGSTVQKINYAWLTRGKDGGEG